jgi:hypothetical protein
VSRPVVVMVVMIMMKIAKISVKVIVETIKE